MKKFKLILTVLAITVFMSCNSKIDTTSDAHPNFKIGKTGFEKILKNKINFKKMSVGTYITKKYGVSEEKGLNLTFQKDNLHLATDSILTVYSNEIAMQVEKYLLNIDNYKYVIIKFEEEKKGEISKSTSIKIKKELK